MNPEIRALGTLTAGIFLILALVLSLMVRQSQRVRGSRRWLVGTLVLSCGLLLNSLRPYLPVLFVNVAGNVAMLCGSLWVALGTFEYRRHRLLPAWLPWAVMVALAVWFGYATFVHNSVLVRVITFSACAALVCFIHLYIVLARPGNGSHAMAAGHWLAAIGQAGAGAMFALRAGEAMFIPEAARAFNTLLEPNQMIVIAAALFMSLTLLGLILILVHELELELRALAGKDPLTGALNRRGLVEALNALPTGTPYSLIMLDIDHFKRINDDFGHAQGDATIMLAVQIMHAHAPANAIFARLGGDEFCLVLPNVPGEAAYGIARAIGQAFHAQSQKFGHTRQHTLSIGVSASGPGTPDLSAMLKRADQALYRVKQGGRNGVELAAA
jgi:diguanylate cyclase (GGDEF)-like protein